MLGKNPDAKDFKGDIETKVMAGYSVEDATYAVLGKAGKLGSSAVEIESAAGGSASNAISSAPAEKSIGDMTQAERRAELSSRADLVDILAPKRQ